jgi:Bacterial SH3 domain
VVAFVPRADGLSAQQRVTLANEAVMQRGADGIELATLPAGTTLRTGKTSGRWVEITLEGWLFARSVEATRREGFDYVVAADDGENLRATPNGTIVARLKKGVLLTRLVERGKWVRVRRTGWVRRARIDESAPVETAALAGQESAAAETPAKPKPKTKAAQQPTTAAKPTQQPAAPAKPAQQPAVAAKPAKPSTSPPAPQAAVPASAPGESPVELAHAAPLFAQPGNGQVADLAQGVSGRVLSQQGEWVRVQFEGWVREGDLKPGSGAALVGVTAAEVRADPARYVGQTVEWRTQFISIQQPDEVRSELLGNQPFLLTRGPLPEPGFVYVIVGRNQLEQFKAVPALQELTLRVTIRAARTKYLATPVVELVSVVSGLPGK